MSTFRDVFDGEWRLELDAFLLDRIESEAKVDLADMSAGGLLAITRDVKALVRVLVVACEEERNERNLSAEAFQKRIRRDAISAAREALLEALADFFPKNDWSAMQSSLTERESRTESTDELAELAPIFAALPEEVKTELFRQGLAELGSSESSAGNGSASALAVTPAKPADDLPENVESAPEGLPSATSG